MAKKLDEPQRLVSLIKAVAALLAALAALVSAAMPLVAAPEAAPSTTTQITIIQGDADDHNRPHHPKAITD